MWFPWTFTSGWASGVSAYLAVLQLGLLGRVLDVGAVPDALTIGGVTAFLSHSTKASLRLVLNASPEPVTNVTTSVGEDLAVASLIAVLVIAPWAAAGVAGLVLVLGLTIVWRTHRRVRRAVAARRKRRSMSSPRVDGRPRDVAHQRSADSR